MTKDAIETGPTPRCLELPSREYINGGTKLESAKYSHHFKHYSHIIIDHTHINHKNSMTCTNKGY